MQMVEVKERAIEKQILDWLTLHGWFAWRFKDQVSFRDGRFFRPPPYQINGVSDLCAINTGIVLFVEVKTPKGRMTKYHKEFQKNILEHGGHYILARRIEDVKNYIDELNTRLEYA